MGFDGFPLQPVDSEVESLPAGSLFSLIQRIQVLIKTLEAEQQSVVPRLEELKSRLQEGRFHLAVLGQFKRGKSTFLNALLGEEVLPSSVIPLTAIPTFLSFGNSRRVRVLFSDGSVPVEMKLGTNAEIAGFLGDFVTEGGNPKNRRNVSLVEVFLPAKILHNGVVLIDTPGIGSTFRHNTEATLNFLPQCDAAVFLVSADPPITEVEIEFLRVVKTKVTRLFFLLNKIDYLDRQEQDIAKNFLRDVLRTQAGFAQNMEIFCVSSRRGVKAKQTADPSLWQDSGLERVESRLIEFLAREKSHTLHAAIVAKTLSFVGDISMTVELRLQAMQMPVNDLAQRIRSFEAELTEIEQERITSHDLLKGSNRRMHAFLEEFSETLREKACLFFHRLLVETMEKGEPGKIGEDNLREVLAQTIPGFFEHEMGASTILFEEKMRQTLKPFQERTDALIGKIRQTAARIFAIPYQAPESSEAFKVIEQPYWVTHTWSSSLKPMAETFMDRFYSPEKRMQRILERIMSQVKNLVIGNVENIRWPIFQSLDQTFLHFGSDLDDRLQSTLTATHGAMKATLACRQEHEAEIGHKLSLFRAAGKNLQEIRDRLLVLEPVSNSTDIPKFSQGETV
jgi:GTP-binding protein EngB required for normal cell division